MKYIISILTLFIFATSYYNVFVGGLEPQIVAVFLLGFLAALVFLTKPMKRKSKEPRGRVIMGIDIFLAILAIALQFYIVVNYNEFINSGLLGKISQTELIVAFIFIALVLECTRRIGGLPIVVLAIVAMLHTVYSAYFPGFFAGAGNSWSTLMVYLFKGDGGLWAAAFNAYTNIIIYFMIFAGVLEISGASRVFIDLALSLTGRYRGGQAKCAIVSSGLMGMIQGAAVSNVVTTGSFTIPLMRKAGYTDNFSAATVSVAATGSMIMPPVMGSAAFIMASFMGVSYSDVCIAAFIPAFLYYLSLYFMIDFRSAKLNIVGMKETPNAIDILKKEWYMLTPLLLIIFLIFSGYSASLAAVWSTLLLILLSFIRKGNRIHPKKFIDSITKSVLSSLSIAMYCAVAGLVVGSITQSGLGMKFSNMVLMVAQNNLFLALVITALASIVLGMGLTTPVVYITVSTLFVPALVNLGITPMAANLFALYFGIVSNVTPPVALASYAAAGVANSDPMKTAIQGFFLGIVAFIVPFVFVYDPSILMIGAPLAIIKNTLFAALGCVALAGGVIGWLKVDLNIFFRIILFVSGILSIWPNPLADVVGVVLFVLVFAYALLKSKKKVTQEVI